MMDFQSRSDLPAGNFTIRSSMGRGLPMLIIPILILVIIIFSGNFYFLEYFHVVVGSAWTGMDLVMGLFFAFIMRGLTNIERAEVSKRLIPTMLFFMPSVATTTITAGVYLALSLGIDLFSLYFIFTAAIALVLTVQGLLIFLPNELRIYSEILKGSRNIEKIVRLTMFNLKLSLSQLVLQIVIIVFMAHFATGVPI